MEKQIIVDIVVNERRQQPRIGGKKLYHLHFVPSFSHVWQHRQRYVADTPESGMGVGYHLPADTGRVRLSVAVDRHVFPQNRRLAFIAGFGDIGLLTGITEHHTVMSQTCRYCSSFPTGGIQYCSHPYSALLLKNRLKISMTEENHCYENALAERVNGILKDEYLLDATFKDYRQAEKACREAVLLYNTRRPAGRREEAARKKKMKWKMNKNEMEKRVLMC
jgi:hypothetical protein